MGLRLELITQLHIRYWRSSRDILNMYSTLDSRYEPEPI